MSFPDPLYGYVRATELEKSIIDLPEFQRLKRIKQLGVANVVFPGALHTRFEHCLGTMHVANLIFERFKNEFDEKDKQKIRLAGLLHDIGHAPFSHTFEIALNRFENIGKPRFTNHEMNTRFIVSNLGKRKKIKKKLKNTNIGEDSISFFKTIGNISTGKKELLNNKDKFLSSIISGEIDADRVDYLFRDSLHTGVNFIGFNLLQLLENISMNEAENKLIIGKQGKYRAFHERISIALGEAILTSRYHHYTYLVNHPRNIAANLMVIKALSIALNNCNKNNTHKEQTKELDNFFFKYDDNDFLNFITKHGDEKAKKLILKYKQGKILYPSLDLKSNALNPQIQFCLQIINDKPSIIGGIEKRINHVIKPNQIYLYHSSVKGIPKNLRLRILGEDRFLYDESRIASGLITEILGSQSLFFFCDNKDQYQQCVKNIRKNWLTIEKLIVERIEKEQIKKPFRLDFLLIIIREFYLFLRLKYKIDNKIENENIRYITRLYEIVKWIQMNYQKRNETNNFPLNYDFDDFYGFTYSPNLFEDIMKLASIRYIKIIMDEKERPVNDFGIINIDECYDYLMRRNHFYYRIRMAKFGLERCKEITKKYLDFVTFVRENCNYIYTDIYN